MAGSGKSTLARRISSRYGLRYYSGGDALKAVAERRGYRVYGEGWWESEEGLRFLGERMSSLDIDREVDQMLIEAAKRGNVVLDSWTMPWLLKEGFKIWLDASEDVRARRISSRDGISLDEAYKYLREKEKRTISIYRKLYGFQLGKDLTPFHLIVDVDMLSADEVFKAVCLVIDNLILKER